MRFFDVFGRTPPGQASRVQLSKTLWVGEPEEVRSSELVLRLLCKILQGKLSTRNKANRLLIGVLYPQTARAHIWLNIHRVESLSPGEAHDRLETPQQGYSSFCFSVLSRHELPPDPPPTVFASLGLE